MCRTKYSPTAAIFLTTAALSVHYVQAAPQPWYYGVQYPDGSFTTFGSYSDYNPNDLALLPGGVRWHKKFRSLASAWHFAHTGVILAAAPPVPPGANIGVVLTATTLTPGMPALAAAGHSAAASQPATAAANAYAYAVATADHLHASSHAAVAASAAAAAQATITAAAAAAAGAAAPAAASAAATAAASAAATAATAAT